VNVLLKQLMIFSVQYGFPRLVQKYLNMATFKISVLFLIKNEHFDIWNVFLPHHIHEL